MGERIRRTGNGLIRGIAGIGLGFAVIEGGNWGLEQLDRHLIESSARAHGQQPAEGRIDSVMQLVEENGVIVKAVVAPFTNDVSLKPADWNRLGKVLPADAIGAAVCLSALELGVWSRQKLETLPRRRNEVM